MTDAWNMTGGKVYVAPAGADPKDPSRWHQLGVLTEMRQDDGWHGGGRTNVLTTRGPLTLFKPEPVKKVEFTFSRGGIDPKLLKLYYGTDVVNNRGETRKEEKYMGVRKFESSHGDTKLRIDSDRVGRTAGSTGAYVKMFDDEADAFGWFEKADVPLIAHALFEKSGWPDAVQDDDGDWAVKSDGGFTRWGFKVNGKQDADKALATAISALAAYNAWAEGTAEREAAEAAKKTEAEEAAAKKREHDELRTSAIALEALALYNEANGTQYGSWSDTAMGFGHADDRVLHYIAKAEAARAARPAPKVGDRVRVSADAGVSGNPRSYFGGEVEGVVLDAPDEDGGFRVKAPTPERPEGWVQWVDPKYVTVVATAEDLAAEKAKAERDAGIAAIAKAADVTPSTATFYYDSGLRAA